MEEILQHFGPPKDSNYVVVKGILGGAPGSRFWVQDLRFRLGVSAACKLQDLWFTT